MNNLQIFWNYVQQYIPNISTDTECSYLVQYFQVFEFSLSDRCLYDI